MIGRGLWEARSGDSRRSLLPGRNLATRWALLLVSVIAMPAATVSSEEPRAPVVQPTRPGPPAAESEESLVVPSPGARPADAGSGRPGGPGLDALLQVPSRLLDGNSGAVAGASEAEWRRRFDRAQDELDAAREGLERTKRELDSVAEGGGASQWSVAAPGGGAPAGGAAGSTSPLSFRLRQELKRNRDRLEQAERSLRELRIEADLAGVPSAWRGAPRPVVSQPELPN